MESVNSQSIIEEKAIFFSLFRDYSLNNAVLNYASRKRGKNQEIIEEILGRNRAGIKAKICCQNARSKSTMRIDSMAFE